MYWGKVNLGDQIIFSTKFCFGFGGIPLLFGFQNFGGGEKKISEK
jgi:hypothetical protein